MTTRARITKPLAEATLAEPEPRYWTNGRYTVSTTTAPHGRSRGMAYPLSLTLMFRAGDDRAYAGYDLTWADVERLHIDLTHALTNRKRYKEAIRKAAANKSLKSKADRAKPSQ